MTFLGLFRRICMEQRSCSCIQSDQAFSNSNANTEILRPIRANDDSVRRKSTRSWMHSAARWEAHCIRIKNADEDCKNYASINPYPTGLRKKIQKILVKLFSIRFANFFHYMKSKLFYFPMLEKVVKNFACGRNYSGVLLGQVG